MGNRAVIDFGENVGVYLHWNGGIESVQAFIDAARKLGIRSPDGDPTYAAARFAQMVGNWFGGTTSVGVGPLDALDCDNGDNGTYVLDGWKLARQDHVDTPQLRAAIRDEGVYSSVLEINQPIFARTT